MILILCSMRGMLARKIIDRLGGYRAVARHLGIVPMRVHNWTRRGVPARFWHRLVDLAAIVPPPTGLAHVRVTTETLEQAWIEGETYRRAANTATASATAAECEAA